MKRLTKLLSLSILLIGFSCSKDNVDPVVPNLSTFKGTQSPGDVWDWTLNHDDNTFTCVWDYGTFDDESDDITVQGSFITLESGFLKCTIINVSPANPDIPADGSAWFYAMYLPNMAMIIKPEGSIKGDLISTVASGECADVPGQYNYFMTAPGNGENYDPLTEEAYGRATFLDNGDNTYNVHGDKYSLDCANGGPCTLNSGITDSPSATCEGGGSISISSGGSTVTEGQFTEAGVMMLDLGKGNGGVLAFDKNKSFGTEELAGTEFIGLAYLPANNTDKTVPVDIKFEDNGTLILGTGRQINNIETGELASDSVTLRLDSNDEGIWLGEMTHMNGLSTPFASSFLVSNDKKMIVLSTVGSPEPDPFIIVVVSK